MAFERTLRRVRDLDLSWAAFPIDARRLGEEVHLGSRPKLDRP
jgi:hypothetical protein